MVRGNIIWALLAAGLALMSAGMTLWHILPALDLHLFESFRLQDGRTWVTALTRLGGFATLAPVTLAVAGLLVIRRRRAEAVWLIATVATGRLAVDGLKLLFERARPPLSGRLDLVSSFSFPSAHSTGTMLTLLALAMLAPRPHLFMPLAIAFAFAMAWTRIALGVHWPSDVLGGLGLGMGWAAIALAWRPGRGASPVMMR